ncbi:helix-turn-helix transcriptional regulator [Sediminibacterium sp. WSJ-3]|nr:helix-turn-helix transcriptional regulator [Sediminibacterium soli]
MHKLAFVLGSDVMAQLSTMDVFEEGKFAFYPRYFGSAHKAMEWITAKEETNTLPFSKEINLLIDHKLGDESATIRLEVDLEQLPFYLKRLRNLLHPKNLSHESYRRFMQLTLREREILVKITGGYSSKQIADELFLSQHTVLTHRRNILRKLDCRNMAELVGYKVFFDL